MRSVLPKNNVELNYEKILFEICNCIKSLAGHNLVSIFLTGSYARGDARSGSDFDIWIILKTIEFKVLDDIGCGLKSLSQSNQNISINPQCLTLSEIKTKHFDNWSEAPVKALDGVVLFGEDLFLGDIDKNKLEGIYKRYLSDILMSVRHYMSVDKPVEKLTYKRLHTYIFKPLLFPLRMERYCHIDEYPLSNNDLLDSYDGYVHDVLTICLDEKRFEEEIAKDHKKLLAMLHKLIEDMLIE